MHECEKTCQDIIKCHFRIFPAIFIRILKAFCLAGYCSCWQWLVVCVHTFEKLPSEKMNTEDAKYQPEEKGDEQYIPNPWNCSEKSVHHNLQERESARLYQNYFHDSYRLSLALFL